MTAVTAAQATLILLPSNTLPFSLSQPSTSIVFAASPFALEFIHMASKNDHLSACPSSACPSSDASMPDSSIRLPPALRRWQASESGDSHLPPHIAGARFPALSGQLLAHAARIAAERDRGEILDYACAMSAVPTVIQEIWLASGELETFALREGIQIESLAELLGEHTPTDSPTTAAQSGVPARVERPLDTFDWLHLALEQLLQIHQDKQRLHAY